MNQSITAQPGMGTAVQPASYAGRNTEYWRRNLVVCVFGSFTTLVSLTMLLPFLPVYVGELGVASQAAIIQWSAVAFGATFLGTAVASPIWGHVADRVGRKPMLVRAAIGMAIVMSLIGMANSASQLVALRLLAGLVGGYFAAATILIGTQAPAERAGWALGILSTGALAGNLIGPLVGGFLPSHLGIRGTFFAGGGLIAIAALLTIVFVKEDFQADKEVRHRASAALQSSAPRTNLAIVSALLVTAMMVLLANMSIEPIITVFIARLDVDHDHLIRIAGLVMAASALGSLLTSARLGALADRVGSWKVIIACLVLTGLVMIPQAFVTHWWQLAVLRLCMGMTLAGLLPAITKLARHAVAEHRTGQLLGFLQSAQFAGQVVGPLLGGQVAIHWGLQSVFFMTALILIASAGLAYWVQRQTDPHHA
ncbi:MAG: MFS transporter [Burkholderiales bacterium]|nr:MFS transporter [Burkholderiales bacterium]